MPPSTDVLLWAIERDGRVAMVREDGAVACDDPDLADFLRARLTEPITVFRRGTVRPAAETDSGPARPIRLAPGDGRYVVARIRSLVAEDARIHLLGIEWA